MPRLSALLFLALAPWLAQAEETLRVYNWNDYIDPQVLESFQKDTGIRVEYHTFATAEELDKALQWRGDRRRRPLPRHPAGPAEGQPAAAAGLHPAAQPQPSRPSIAEQTGRGRS